MGGSGKTPLVIWLVRHLIAQGYRPGIVARGYGGRAPSYPRVVTPGSRPELCGDEAVDLAQQTGVPVVVSPDRSHARRWLQEMLFCELAVSDDGLQHYAMNRQLEILVVNARRGFGNEQLLPAGPLREPLARLSEVDLIVLMTNELTRQDAAAEAEFSSLTARVQQFALDTPIISCRMKIAGLTNGTTGERVDITQMKKIGKRHSRWVAVTGIADARSFHASLIGVGVEFERCAFADHHAYGAEDLLPFRGAGVLTTTKDAVKIRQLMRTNDALHDLDIWVLERTIELDAHAQQRLDSLIATRVAK